LEVGTEEEEVWYAHRAYAAALTMGEEEAEYQRELKTALV
jgi:hypothetical protein